jgi:hypothetical protein
LTEIAAIARAVEVMATGCDNLGTSGVEVDPFADESVRGMKKACISGWLVQCNLSLAIFLRMYTLVIG